MGLHPAVAATRLAVRHSLGDLEPGDTVVVACSGGPDSVALLAATVFEARAGSWQVIGVTVDHGLQPGSAAHAVEVADQMTAIGADETVVATVKVEAPGMGPEAAARSARYSVLEELAERRSAAAVLLGHTLDDQAETVLLGLTRGGGGRALAGMRRSFEGFRRPFLDLTRDDTVTACTVEGLTTWDDPHNVDPRFTRVRVRTEVLPMLEREIGPGVARNLARTADLLRADAEYLDEVAEAARLQVTTEEGLDVTGLGLLPDAVRRRVLRAAAIDAGAPAGELFHVHVQGIDSLVTDWHGQTGADLPGHLRAIREGGSLVFRHHT